VRIAKSILASLLLSSLLLPCRAERELFFTVVGGNDSKTQYSVKKSELSEGGHLFFTLNGTFPAQPIEVRLIVKDKYGAPSFQKAKLSLNGLTITANQESMSVPAKIVSELLSRKQYFTLSIPSSIPPDATMSLIATTPGSVNAIASLDILVEGLRTPGREAYDINENFFLHVAPLRIGVYQSSTDDGSVTIDLQNVPQGNAGTLELIDLLGVTVHTQSLIGGTKVQIPARTVKRGLYFIRISIEDSPLYTGRILMGN
jgi:hypothetical protein